MNPFEYFTRPRKNVTTSKKSEPGIERTVELAPQAEGMKRGLFGYESNREPSAFGIGANPVQGAVQRAISQPAAMQSAPPMSPTTAPAQDDTLSSVKKYFESQQNQGPSGIRGAIGRALMGFSRGFAATPDTARYNPVGAGIAGGLAGTGQFVEDDLKRRFAADAPRRELANDILKERVLESMREPTRIAKEKRQQADKQANIQRRHDLRMEEIKGAVKARADQLGIDSQVYDKAYKEAGRGLMIQGILPDDPRYDTMAHERALQHIQRQAGAGVRGAGKPGAAPAKPAVDERGAARKRLGL